MRILRAPFLRLVDVTRPNLIRAVGVYVIWDARATAGPQTRPAVATPNEMCVESSQ